MVSRLSWSLSNILDPPSWDLLPWDLLGKSAVSGCEVMEPSLNHRWALRESVEERRASRMVCDEMEWDEMGWGGMGWVEMGCYGMGWDGIGWAEMGCDGLR